MPPKKDTKKTNTKGQPKENYQPVSRDNLTQYKSENKVKQYEKKFEDFIKKNKIDISLQTLRDLIPYNDVFKEKEQGQFFNMLILSLQDYTGEIELNISDLHELINIAKLNVLKYRILKESKKGVDVKDAVRSLEALDKTIEKVKVNLGANRVARIDPRTRKDINIIDIIAQYETQKGRDKVLSDIEKMLEEEAETSGYSTTMDELIE